MYTSTLSKIFDNNEFYEDTFRRNCIQQFSATELAYCQRYLKGEKELYNLIGFGNVQLIDMLNGFNKE
jgi:hypothetical protein